MVGADLPRTEVASAPLGPSLLTLSGVVTPDRGAAPGLRGIDLDLRGGRITGLAGVSGNGQK